jgi:hypothetical protein
MSLFHPALVTSGLLVTLGLALSAAAGQEDAKQSPRKAVSEPAVARQVYAVHGRTAKELADVLTLHFQTEPAFQAVPDPVSNTLLLSGPKAALAEAIALLREIDRPPRMVHVEIFVLELSGGDAKALDGVELSGTAQDLKARLRDLQQKGAIVSIKTVELTTLERQTARSQVGENRPFVTGMGIGAGGFGGRGGGGAAPGGGGPGGGTVTRSIAFRNVGTSVRVMPEVGADGQLTLDLQVEDSRMRTAEGSATVGTDEKGTAVGTPEFFTSTLESRLKVRPGCVVQAQSMKASSKSGQTQTVVFVSASTDEARPKEGK